MRKRTYLLWKKILIWTAVCVFVLGVYATYMHSPLFTVTSFSVTGVPKEYEGRLQEKMKEVTDKKLYGFIPKNKILTPPRDAMRTAIISTLPTVNHIRIYPTGLHTLHITVASFSPSFKLTDGRAVTTSGHVYTEIHELSAYPTLELGTSSAVFAIEKVSGVDYTRLVLQKATSTTDVLTELKEVLPKIEAVLFPVDTITFGPDRELILSNKVQRHSLKISRDTNLETVWSTVISAIDTEPLKSLLQTRKKDLEYIDMRFGSKVFYKFTNTTVPTIINASTTPHDTHSTSTTALH